jgi:hypothetical protein
LVLVRCCCCQVEAFPNKNSILIDNFKQLNELVDR